MAPPPGIAFDTAVVDWVSTPACATVMPGVATTTTTQYVSRFQIATSTSTVTSRQVRVRSTVLTSERLANWPKTNLTIRPTSATETRICRTRLTRGSSHRRLPGLASASGTAATAVDGWWTSV